MRRVRIGFSIIELLVVLAIISILVSLLLVGVLSVRNSSRRIACANNLHQIGIALHNFNASQRHFPTARIKLTSITGTSYWGSASGHYQMIAEFDPVLAEEPLFPSLSSAWSAGDFPQVGLYSARVSVFICPADGSDAAGTNYRFCTGPDAYTEFRPSLGEGGLGLFNSGKEVTAASLSRGMSNTIGVSERLRSLAGGSFEADRDVWLSGIHPVFPITHPPTNAFIAASDAARGQPLRNVERMAGHVWLPWAYTHTLYNHVFTPNSGRVALLGANSNSLDTWSGGVVGASSEHPGGVNALTMDGAVSFRSDTVDVAVWRELASSCLRQPIVSSGQYSLEVVATLGDRILD